MTEPLTFGEAFGLPQRLLVDNGPESKSLALVELLAGLGSDEDSRGKSGSEE
jgi:hypothetical protein